MTRSDLIRALARRFPHLSLNDADLSVKMLLDALASALARGDRIEIRDFGCFTVNRRLARTGRNPKTGESVIVPAKLVPHFKAGKELRERVDVLTVPVVTVPGLRLRA